MARYTKPIPITPPTTAVMPAPPCMTSVKMIERTVVPSRIWKPFNCHLKSIAAPTMFSAPNTNIKPVNQVGIGGTVVAPVASKNTEPRIPKTPPIIVRTKNKVKYQGLFRCITPFR